MERPTTLGELFAHAPPRDVAVVDGEMRHSTTDLDAAVVELAAGLAGRGVGAGDTIAFQLPNWHESILCYRAAWSLGAVAAPLHHRAGATEVRRWLDTLSPEVVITAPNLPAAELADRTRVIEARGDGGFEALTGGGSGEPPAVDVGPDDRALVMFTSGSSSEPKGVVHTHRSLAHKGAEMVGVHGLTDDDVVLMPAPMAHVSGLLNGLLVPAAAGMATVLMDHWDPAAALDLIEAEQVSFMVGPPTFFHGLLDDPSFSAERVASLRLISCGGAGVTPSFVREASTRLDAVVKRSYGSTEAPTITTTHAGDPPEMAATTDGRVSGGAELRVVDPATDERLDAGQAGELWVRGPELFSGYLDPTQTDEVVVDGWFRTGDLAVVDVEGWLTITGRVKDVIIRGGENISPAEIEAALEAHRAVSRAVAVGIPDERLGEIVGVAVVAIDDFDLAACRSWFAEHGVARFKTPEVVEVVKSFPLLASGKPDRRAIAEQLRAVRAVKPLDGVRVLDLGTRIAAPFCAGVMAELGAEVIKIEQPGRGDFMRDIGPFVPAADDPQGPADHSLFFAVEGRDRKSVTLDLRSEPGQGLFRRLAARADVVVENFRPGTLERWHIAPSDLADRLIVVRISSYGQTGPLADRPGLDRTGIAHGGLLHLTGHPDRPPVRVGVTISDYLTGTFSANAAIAALYARDARGGSGAVIDAALYGATMRILEWTLPAYDLLGTVRERQGNRLANSAPLDNYESADGRYVCIVGGGDANFARLCDAMERPDLLDDDRFGRLADRAAHGDVINGIVDEWCAGLTAEEVERRCVAAGVPVATAYSAADIFAEPHMAERGDLVTVDDPVAGPMRQQAPFPRFVGEEPHAPTGAPRLGEHTDEVLADLLGLTDAELADLHAENVV